jgi:hypothetical protein
MTRFRGIIMTALLITASFLLPGAEATCDWEDAVINLDIEGCSSHDCSDDHHDGDDDHHDGDDCSFDFWCDD